MIRGLMILLAAVGLGSATCASGDSQRILKVLPLLLDEDGRHTRSPSLYERDAYQDYLREHPQECHGRRFSIHWTGRSTAEAPLHLKVELRGLTEETAERGLVTRELTIETSPSPRKRGRHWTHVEIEGQDYQELGPVTAWRVTLWSGDLLLDEYKSFLW